MQRAPFANDFNLRDPHAGNERRKASRPPWLPEETLPRPPQQQQQVCGKVGFDQAVEHVHACMNTRGNVGITNGTKTGSNCADSLFKVKYSTQYTPTSDRCQCEQMFQDSLFWHGITLAAIGNIILDVRILCGIHMCPDVRTLRNVKIVISYQHLINVL